MGGKSNRKWTPVQLGMLILILLMPNVMALKFERPLDHFSVGRRDEASSTDEKASVGLGVHVSMYEENCSGGPYDGKDVFRLYITATGNTRQIIGYSTSREDAHYHWYSKSNLTSTLYLGDDEVYDLFLESFTIRFFGGPGSGEYNHIYIGSNGFLSFHHPGPENSYCPMSASAFIAPFWKDLKPNSGSTIKYGIVDHQVGASTVQVLVISWEDFPDAGGELHSFQVLVEKAPYGIGGWEKLRQSRIWFQYETIALNDPRTRVGIGDQLGGKAVNYDYQDLGNRSVLEFFQNTNSALISYLAIKLIESEDTASTLIHEEANLTGGKNVIFEDTLAKRDRLFETAVRGGLTLLTQAAITAGAKIGWVVPGAGFMIGMTLIGISWAQAMAEEQVKGRLLYRNNTYARAHAIDAPDDYVSNAVDADFCISVDWVLNDANTADHSITIVAEHQYVEYTAGGQDVGSSTISTSVVLTAEKDASNYIYSAGPISPGSYYNYYLDNFHDKNDYWRIDMSYIQGKSVSVVMMPPSDCDFDLDLWILPTTGGWRPVGSSHWRGIGVLEVISAVPVGSDWLYAIIQVSYYSGYRGFFNMTIEITNWSGNGGGGDLE